MMQLTESTKKAIYAARQSSPELEAALDEVAETLTGILGALETVGRMERPLDDTEEHKGINAALDNVALANMAAEALYYALAG